MKVSLDEFGLRYHPFEPAASGAPPDPALWLPQSWDGQLRNLLATLSGGTGAKLVAVTGEYGSGKTYVLHWLCRSALPELHVRPFYFENPTTEFYGLANQLLRQVGRHEFAKSLWELAEPYTSNPGLFPGEPYAGYVGYAHRLRAGGRRSPDLSELQNALKRADVTSDDQIAYLLARIVVDTPLKPYFEYQDFVAGKHGSLVAEREEAPYFGAILRVLRMAAGLAAVAFVIDEFEEIALGKQFTRREVVEYLGTLRRLVSLTQGEDLWLVLGMTPDAFQKTQEIVPALAHRFATQGEYQFAVPHLSKTDAQELVHQRLARARLPGFEPPNPLFPFPDDFASALSPTVVSIPRYLVKVCYFAISDAPSSGLFTPEYLRTIEAKAGYGVPTNGRGQA